MWKLKNLSVGEKFMFVGDLSRTVYILISLNPCTVVDMNGNETHVSIGDYVTPIKIAQLKSPFEKPDFESLQD